MSELANQKIFGFEDEQANIIDGFTNSIAIIGSELIFPTFHIINIMGDSYRLKKKNRLQSLKVTFRNFL